MKMSLSSDRLRGAVVLAGLCLVSVIVTGCGSSEGSNNGANAAKDPKASGDKGDSKPGKSNDSKPGKTAGGPKMIDGILWDVFYDKPLEVAANKQTGTAASDDTVVAANETPKGPATADMPAEKKEPAKEAGGDATSLKDLLDKEALASEVKNVRNYLAGKAASVAAYNASYLEIAPESATLAALAVAVQKHPEDFSWKKNAKFVRELSTQITELTTTDKAKNKNTYDAVAAAFEKIDDILKGSTPAGLPEATDEKDYGEAAVDLRHIMKRIQKAEANLKNSVSNEAGLKKDADKVAQEGAVLQFLGHAIISNGFGWGDDAGFHKQAKPLREGGKQLIEAAKSGNYALYDEAMGRISKSCVECHGEFKNN
ncbi:MAG: cytochrome c [Planctomycetaceae bacterium]